MPLFAICAHCARGAPNAQWACVGQLSHTYTPTMDEDDTWFLPLFLTSRHVFSSHNCFVPATHHGGSYCINNWTPGSSVHGGLIVFA